MSCGHLSSSIPCILNNHCSFVQELDLLEDDAKVFKMIGAVLVRQDLTEAKAVVAKRIEYITSEVSVNILSFWGFSSFT